MLSGLLFAMLNIIGVDIPASRADLRWISDILLSPFQWVLG
jgi:hypothetical protein